MKSFLHAFIRKYFLLGMLFFILLSGDITAVFAQRISSRVRIMLEKLSLEKQEKLKDFSDDVETYINHYDWTGDSYDEEIPVDIQIYLMDYSVSYEDRYSGTFLITNNLDNQYYDKYWRFPYEAGESLEHTENEFNPFGGFIDFYINIIIGEEYDKYGRFFGTPFFEKAKLISDQAKFSSRFALGWDERSEFIDHILSEENQPFRIMKDLFFLGLSYVGEEDSTARKYCSQALLLLEEVLANHPENEKAMLFLSAYRMEYVNLFKDDRGIIEKLIKLDPDHEEIYRGNAGY